MQIKENETTRKTNKIRVKFDYTKTTSDHIYILYIIIEHISVSRGRRGRRQIVMLS